MADCEVNLAWPRQGLIGTLEPFKLNQRIALLPKLRPTEADRDLSEIKKLQVTL